MEKIKEGIKWIGDSMTGAIRTFLIGASIIILAFGVASLLFSCNDNGTPSPVPVQIDTIKTPGGKDSVIYQTPTRLFSDSVVNRLFGEVQMPSTDMQATTVRVGDNVQSLIDAAPIQSVFRFEAGDYYFSEPLTWKNKSVFLVGTNGTRFIFPNGKSGIVINRDQATPRSRIQNIRVETFGEKVNPDANGVTVTAVTDLYNVFVKNFAGRGFAFIADVQTSKTDVIQSQVYNCEAAECGSDGFYFQGGDASSINVIGCSARDNGGYGFWDNSFLGNHFFGTISHAAKKGHYRADNGNNRSTFTGCYAEQDSPMSIFGGLTRVYGGLHGWQLIDVGPQYGPPVYQYKTNPEIAYRGWGDYILGPNAIADAY
jgi:hypothetical protein